MAGGEQTLWSRLQRFFTDHGADAIRVENKCLIGTPDVQWHMAGIDAWLELKHAEAWPKKPETKLALEHFTPQQRVFLTKRRYAGGRADLLLKVGRDWLLFDGLVASKILGRAPKAELWDAAVMASNGLNEDRLYDALVRPVGIAFKV